MDFVAIDFKVLERNYGQINRLNILCWEYLVVLYTFMCKVEGIRN